MSPANSAISSLDNSTYGSVDAYPHSREDILIAGLRALRPMGLPRTDRLRDDLRKLRHETGMEEDEMGTSDMVQGIMFRMESEVREKPHLLIAYAFTLYLAILSGGRHIRSELCKAGVDFWTCTPPSLATQEKKSAWNWRSPVPSLSRLNPYAKSTTSSTSATAPLDSPARSHKPLPLAEISHFESMGLSFWFFPGSSDGEDIRAKFKANLEELSQFISPRQEDEIVAEAQLIFSQIEALVGELDIAVATQRALGALADVESDTEVDIDVETSQSAVLEQALEEEVRVEELQTSPTSLTAVSPSDETSLLVGPYWVGLAVVMCGVSYAAMVYSKTWSGV